LLETEADAIGSELLSPGINGEPPAGIKEPLIDKEGYPRGDIDIYRVRTLRGRLAVINTDHKELMKDIQKEVHALHQAAPAIIRVDEDTSTSAASAAIAGAGGDSAARANTQSYNDILSGVMTEVQPSSAELYSQYNHYGVIAILDQILADSPASAARLVDGMQLLAFGEVNVSSSGSAGAALQSIPAIVRTAFANQQAIRLIVRCAATTTTATTAGAGAGEIKRVFLKPLVWAGRGLLGVHLTPV
jgi:26S proteasome non-ATPase regulatory subunit 9